MRGGPHALGQAGGQNGVKSAGSRMDAGFWVVPDRATCQPQGGTGNPSSATLKVDRLMDAAFFPGRTPRSAEYRAGCRAALEFRLAGKPLPMPYAAGNATADAFLAGIDEGHAILQRNEAATKRRDGFVSMDVVRRTDVLGFQGICNAQVSK